MSEIQLPSADEMKEITKENNEKRKKGQWEKLAERLRKKGNGNRMNIFYTEINAIPSDEFERVMKDKGFKVAYFGDNGHTIEISW